MATNFSVRPLEAGHPATQQYRRDRDAAHARPSAAHGSNLAWGRDANLSLLRQRRRSVAITPALERPSRAGDQSSYRGRIRLRGRPLRIRGRAPVGRRRLQPGIGLRLAAAISGARPRALGSAPDRSGRADSKAGLGRQLDYITNADGSLVQNREAQGHLPDRLPQQRCVDHRFTRDYEWLPNSFSIAPGVTVPRGGYTLPELSVGLHPRPQRRVSGNSRSAGGRLQRTKTKRASAADG